MAFDDEPLFWGMPPLPAPRPVLAAAEIPAGITVVDSLTAALDDNDAPQPAIERLRQQCAGAALLARLDDGDAFILTQG